MLKIQRPSVTSLINNAQIHFVNDFSVMGDQATVHDLILKVEVECLGFLIPEMVNEITQVG